MILNELFNLSELSPGTLASYKKKAGADASAADAAGDYARGNKRFSGIVKATKKEFAKNVAENVTTKFDPSTGIPVTGQLSELEGDATQFATPTQSTPVTDQPPRRGYTITLVGKPGRDYQAIDAWNALAKVFPRDYPPVDRYGNGPAQQKVYEVVQRGFAVVKTGIASEDIAETLVSKLTRFNVPTENWQITSEELDEGVMEGEQRMSRAAKGNKKYGKDGMQALRDKAMSGASEKEMDATRDEFNKYDDQVDEAAEKGLYYNVNKRKAAGTSRPASSPKAPTAQAWKDAAKTAKKESVSEGINDRGFFNNVEQWHEAKSDIEHDDQWETPKFIVVKNNGETVAKWSKADSYGWVDSSQQGVAEAAKWRQGYSASGHPAGFKHKSGEVGPIGGTYTNEPSGYDGETSKVPVQKYRDKSDELSDRARTKLSTAGKPLLPKNAQKHLKAAIIQSKGKHGPVSNIPEQGVAEGIGQQLGIDQLAAISDEALDKAYGYGRSTPGNTFGWQANLKSAAYAKQVIDAGVTDIEKISDAIHKGWNVTAKAFVQNPDQFADTEKLKAAGKLEAKLAQRAKLMNIGYGQLPDDEQEKDRVVARALLSALTGQQGVAEGNLEEIDRRGFLQGLGAAALGAAGISASGNAQARGKPEFMAQLGKARELLSKGLTPDQVAKQMGITGPNHGKSGPMIGDGWAAINYAAQQSKSNRQQAADIQEQGVAEGYNGEYDDEAGMADNNLETLKRAVEGIDDVISAGDNLPEWCQEKIAVSKSMLVAVWDYMRSEEESEEDPESSELQFMLNSAGLGGNR